MDESSIHIGIAVIIAGLYTFVLFLCNKLDRNWWNAFFSAVIAMYFAVSVGFYLFDKQSKISDNNRRNELKMLLAQEISDTVTLLNQSDLSPSISATKYLNPLVYVQPLAVEEAFKSGLFKNDLTREFYIIGQMVRTYMWGWEKLVSVLFLDNSPRNVNIPAAIDKTSEQLYFIRKNIVWKMIKNVQEDLKLSYSYSGSLSYISAHSCPLGFAGKARLINDNHDEIPLCFKEKIKEENCNFCDVTGWYNIEKFEGDPYFNVESFACKNI